MMSTISLVESIDKVLQKYSVFTLVKALLISAACFFIYRALIRLLTKKLQHSNMEDSHQRLILRSLKILLVSAMVLLIVAELNINISSVLLILAAAIVAFFLAAEDILKNVACGIVMSSTKPFAKGDFISVGGKEGTVVEIRLNCTKLKCLTGEIVTVPNAAISAATVVNCMGSGSRCIVLKIKASYESDPEKVMEVCRDLLCRTPGILQEIPPQVFVSEYGESNIQYDLYFWVLPEEYLLRKYEVNGKIYQTFKKEGIRISGQKVCVEMSEDFPSDERRKS